MKRVLLDCDGVIADFVSDYLALLNEAGGTTFTHSDITDWDIASCLKVPKDVEDAANAHITYDFCRNLRPLDGAVDGVRALMDVADVYIVTSPWVGCKGWTEARYEWLLEHCGIKSKQVLHGSAKHICDGDLFVDDKESTVVQWQQTHPKSVGVVWSQPWNRFSMHWARTGNWSQLVRLVTK